MCQGYRSLPLKAGVSSSVTLTGTTPRVSDSCWSVRGATPGPGHGGTCKLKVPSPPGDEQDVTSTARPAARTRHQLLLGLMLTPSVHRIGLQIPRDTVIFDARKCRPVPSSICVRPRPTLPLGALDARWCLRVAPALVDNERGRADAKVPRNCLRKASRKPEERFQARKSDHRQYPENETGDAQSFGDPLAPNPSELERHNRSESQPQGG